MSLPLDVPHPATFTDERLKQVLYAIVTDDKPCPCNTCRQFNDEALLEGDRRGFTGQRL